MDFSFCIFRKEDRYHIREQRLLCQRFVTWRFQPENVPSNLTEQYITSLKWKLDCQMKYLSVQNHFARGGFYKLFFSKYPSCNNPCNNEIVGFPINIHVLWIPSFHSMEIIIILIFDFLCAPVNTYTLQMNFDRTIVKSKKINGFIFLKSKSIEWNPESDIFYKIKSKISLIVLKSI